MAAPTRRTSRRKSNSSWLQRALLPLLLLCALFVVACSGLTLKGARADAPSGAGKKAAASRQAAQDKGDFKVAYVPAKNADYKEYETAFKDSKLFEEISKGLNESLILPHDVTLEFKECGEINAFYDPETKKIEMCYELVENSANVFKDDKKTEDELVDAVLGSTVWTYFHELGHALVDVYDLPVTGKEEDAVDQLSTIILTLFGDDGEKMALAGAREFYLEAQRDGDLDDHKFADTHSLDKQRFFNIICLIYGHSPAKYASLTKDGTLPGERSKGCEFEYEQIERSWGKLLDPYIKD